MLKCKYLALLLGLAGLAAIAQEGGDLQAQIMYAFYAEDANRLSSLVQTLRTQVEAGGDAALRYHLAHADYRLGLLSNDRQAAAAFEECIDELKPLLERDADAVESMLLQSTCYSHLAHSDKLRAMMLRSRATLRLRNAGALAPRNPRVLYVRAMDDLARAAPGSARSAQALEELALAAQLFEQTSATRLDVPGWGDAETYLELGRELQTRGDSLGARNWIEKSLLSAPDYKAAQRQLARLSAH